MRGGLLEVKMSNIAQIKTALKRDRMGMLRAVLRAMRLPVLAISLMGSMAVAGVDDDVKKIQGMVQDCVVQERDVCVVFGATQLMTDIASLNYLYTNDKAGLDTLVSAFEKASFKMSSTGRADFRKFLSENAIWTLDYYNERFLAEVDPDYAYEDVRHFYAAYQLMRADACNDLKNAPCAESALWNVRNAQTAERWPSIVERFAMEQTQAETLVSALFETYKGRF
tara:strand:+ start:6917 stop:7591 length:675 start_codon:yes stop_codon:yes gene_type:complete